MTHTATLPFARSVKKKSLTFNFLVINEGIFFFSDIDCIKHIPTIIFRVHAGLTRRYGKKLTSMADFVSNDGRANGRGAL